MILSLLKEFFPLLNRQLLLLPHGLFDLLLLSHVLGPSPLTSIALGVILRLLEDEVYVPLDVVNISVLPAAKLLNEVLPVFRVSVLPIHVEMVI